MTTITQVITTPGTAPARSQAPETFIINADAHVAWQATLVSDANTWAGQVNTVATEINAVAADAATITANIANVNAVGADLLEPTSEINTVATDIANVNTVGTAIANVNTVAGISANVTTVAGISGNVTTVAGISANVTSVAGNATNINLVAGDATDIGVVAAANAAIGTVSTNIANVNTVAGISANVTTVAGVSASVTTVAGIASDVSAVAAQFIGWNFSTTTTMADPGSGIMRFNNATLASVTAIALDDNNSAAADVSAYVLTWDDSTSTIKGTITVRQGTANFAVFNVTGLTDNAGWTQVAVTHVSSSGTFANATLTFVDFDRSGDAGTGDASTANPLSQFAATTSLQLAGVISDETGSGALVFATSPTLVTPALGTPSSGNLGSCTDAVAYGLKSATTTVSVSAATAPTAGQVLTATAGTTATWQAGVSATKTISGKTGAYTVIATDLGAIINCTANSFTVSLTAAATLGAGFNCWVWNTSTNATHAITIDPSGAETIDGVTTLILRRGEGLQLVCDGTNWQTGDKKAMRGYAENLVSTTARPVVTGAESIALGSQCTASGTYAVLLSTNHGGASTASGNGSVVLSGGGSIASGEASVCIGEGTQATGIGSTAIGKNSGATGSQAITGAGAMALGGSYASGTDSFAAAIANNTSSYGATGANSVAIGETAKASNTTSVAIGAQQQASGSYSVSLGGNGGGANVASGSMAVAIGGGACTASGENAVAFGAYTTASGQSSYALGKTGKAIEFGKYVYSSGSFVADYNVAGDAQTGTMVLRKSTTDATPSAVTANGAAAAATNQVILPNDSTYAFTILVVARRTDADNESAGYEFKGVVDRNANAASTALVGTVAKTVLAEDTAAWDCNVTADTTNGGLSVTVTGEAGKTIRWVCTCWTVEVSG